MNSEVDHTPCLDGEIDVMINDVRDIPDFEEEYEAYAAVCCEEHNGDCFGAIVQFDDCDGTLRTTNVNVLQGQCDVPIWDVNDDTLQVDGRVLEKLRNCFGRASSEVKKEYIFETTSKR